ncbi:MAG: M23 family metallopeptidase [Cytophagales bacterium]|nr:M23 family metallopeptidase [Cytophagales bacterium]
MTIINWRFLYTVVLVLPLFLGAQSPTFTSENYYLFPIYPGQTHYLAGTMGEMRGTHFHGGIDIRTGGKTGLPVLATADGYISRIRVQRGGYGHVLYMQHPNGTSSVYAHLKRFAPELEEYLREQQYKKKSYELDLFPDKNAFPFRQGEMLAYSGNTGSSSGPHLHFEIRDSKQRVLDPLKFNFKEIRDNIAPTLRKVAFVCLDDKARVNGVFGRFEFEVIQNEGKYRIPKPLQLEGKIGVEIDYIDRHNGSSARNGIPEIMMTVDNDTVFHQRKARMAFNEMRNIVVHMDYETYVNRRRKFNKLFKDEGNTLGIYLINNEGVKFNSEGSLLNIYLQDAYGNLSILETKVNNRKIVNRPEPTFRSFLLRRNWLHLQSALGDSAEVVLQNDTVRLEPYTQLKKQFYLWDLRKGLPTQFMTSSDTVDFRFQQTIPNNQTINFAQEGIDIEFKKTVLFDTLYLRYEKSSEGTKEYWDLPHADFPLRRPVKVTLSPEQEYTEQHHVYSVWGKKSSFIGGEWKDGKITFYTRDLGKFTIEKDISPPTVRNLKMARDGITLLIDDAKSGIKSYKAFLNGEWLMMAYDAKKKKIWAVPRVKDQPLEGNFRLEITDNAGNERIYEKQIPTT